MGLPQKCNLDLARARLAGEKYGVSAVAEALAHNLQGYSQHVEAAPRGGAEGIAFLLSAR